MEIWRGTPHVTTQQREIVLMCRESVPIATCLRRLANWCLSNGVDISEGGSKLKAEFQKPMLVAYRDFFRDVIECIYVCGFVPWYEGDVGGVKVPRVLPLGSFVWRVETQQNASRAVSKTASEDQEAAPEERERKRHKRELYEYKLSIVHGDVKESAVHIIPFLPARINAPISPLQGLYFRYVTLQSSLQMMQEMASFNSQKHCLFSEKISFNELGTTSGIALLDEFRHYTITGKFTERDSTRFRTRTGQVLSNINDANYYWIDSEFRDDNQHHDAVHPSRPHDESGDAGVVGGAVHQHPLPVRFPADCGGGHIQQDVRLHGQQLLPAGPSPLEHR